MKLLNTKLLPAALLIPAWIASSQVFALADDRNQPVQIQADSAERNGKTGMTEYRGAVDIQQGSTHIKADAVSLKTTASGELDTIVATGKPATFEQKLSNSNDRITGQANRINVQVHNDLVILENNAVLDQKSGNISGEHIEYDMRNERVNARGAAGGNSGKRLTVIIPPTKAGKAGSARVSETMTPDAGTTEAGTTESTTTEAAPPASDSAPAADHPAETAPASPDAADAPLAPLSSETVSAGNSAAPATTDATTDATTTESTPASEPAAPSAAKPPKPRIGRSGAAKQ